MSYLLDFAGRPIPQSEPESPKQVQNNAGGYSFKLDKWAQLERFLILGSEGGTYYASERDLTKENLTNLKACISSNGVKVVQEAVNILVNGRAPKLDPCLYAIALVAKTGNAMARSAALTAIPSVCKTGTQILHMANFINSIGGWGRGTRRAIANWFNSRDSESLGYQVAKYQSRDGWAMRDLLRLSHVKPIDSNHNSVYKWVLDGTTDDGALPRTIEGFEKAKSAIDANQVVQYIADYKLPRECVPTKWLDNPVVWYQLLQSMPVEATVRNLATMTKLGLFDDHEALELVTNRLGDKDIILKSKIHPIKILSAMETYKRGKGIKGSSTWKPVSSIIDALDAAFYSSFGCVTPTGKHHVLAFDVSGSMWSGDIGGVPGLVPAVAACAMGLITRAVEKRCTTAVFNNGYSGIDLSARRRLDDNLTEFRKYCNGGGTDCSLPMLHAAKNKADVDCFVVYTDNETWAGNIHPHIALEKYRQACGHDAKLIVVGMTSNGFTIANPSDAGMLDVVGFDTATPQLMSDFAKN